MIRLCAYLLSSLLILMLSGHANAQTRFKISFDFPVHQAPITGRVVLAVSRFTTPEPRLRIRPNGDPAFGVDAENLAPGQFVVIDRSAVGQPVDDLAELPSGDYYVQAIMNVYTRCHRSDGHVLWVHLDRNGLPFNISPGNLYSGVKEVHFDPHAADEVEVKLDHVIPDAKLPSDTKWVKHISLKSELLTKFWGQPMYLGATVLLPKGYQDHPDDRYPVAYAQGFLGEPAFGFDTDPATLKQRESLKKRGCSPDTNSISRGRRTTFRDSWPLLSWSRVRFSPTATG